MNRRMKIALLAAFSMICLSIPYAAPAADQPAAKEKPAGEEMAPPRPGPMHALLQKSVGKWKAVTKMMMAPDQPPMISEGTMELESVSGGLWFTTTFKTGDPMPMEGHGIDGYDETKQKFVGMWVDSWSTSVSTFEGTADADGKVFTYQGSGIGMDGKPVTYTSILEVKDENTHVWRMWQGPKAEGPAGIEITYTRM